MNAPPAALWTTQWRNTHIAVFATADDSALTVPAAAAIISADEQARADRFHFTRDCERWMRSRALLRLSLSHRSGIPAERITFQAGPQGKPSLPAHPDCQFNLSHSAEFTAIAVGPVPVGIDIEKRRDNFSAATVAGHVLRPDEASAIATSAEPALLFYRLWTTKEAVMKCSGLGLSLAPSAIRVDCGAGGIPFQALRTDDGTGYDVMQFTHPADVYVLTVALRTGLPLA